MAGEKKCSTINHPNLVPGWGCCECHTFNGNQRDECKNPQCNHARCDNPAVKRIAIKEDNGVRLILVKTNKDELN
jgi:hypothetical protein